MPMHAGNVMPKLNSPIPISATASPSSTAPTSAMARRIQRVFRFNAGISRSLIAGLSNGIDHLIERRADGLRLDFGRGEDLSDM